MLTEKTCVTCKQLLPATEFYPHKKTKSGLQPACRTCSRQWHRDRPDYIRAKNAEYKKKNPTYARDWQRKKKFGLSIDQVNAIRESQGGLCPGCQRQLSEHKECIDHCHSTGKVRGLLCDDCNIALGRVRDSMETLARLASYLERHARIEAESY